MGVTTTADTHHKTPQVLRLKGRVWHLRGMMCKKTVWSSPYTLWSKGRLDQVVGVSNIYRCIFIHSLVGYNSSIC